MMANSSLDAIKSAELQAEGIVKSSRVKANKIILDAENEAKSLVNLAKRDAESKANEMIDVANRDAVEYLEKEQDSLNSEILKFRTEVLEKENLAVKAAINLVFNDF